MRGKCMGNKEVWGDVWGRYVGGMCRGGDTGMGWCVREVLEEGVMRGGVMCEVHVWRYS